MREEDSARIIAGIYDAALDEALWPDVMERLRVIMHASIGVLYVTPVNRPEPKFLARTAHDETFEAAYRDYYCRLDPFHLQARRNPKGGCTPTQQIISDSALVRTEFYNGFMRHLDFFYSVGGTVFSEDGAIGVMGIPRAHGQDSYSDAEVGAVAALFPHIAQAARINRKLARAAGLSDIFGRIIEEHGEALIVTGGDGELIYASPSAAREICPHCALRLEGRMLAASNAADTARLRSAIADAAGAATGQPGPAHTHLLLPRAEGEPLIASVGGIVIPQVSALAPPQPGAILFISHPQHTADPVARAATAYRLTAAETRLLRGLLSGRSVQDLSGEFGISRNTLRVQLQRLFDKTGTNRQSQLIRKILTESKGVM